MTMGLGDETPDHSANWIISINFDETQYIKIKMNRVVPLSMDINR